MKRTFTLNQKGQAFIEYTLLVSIAAVAWVGVAKVLQRAEFIQKTFGQPWGRLSNTIEFGVPTESRALAGVGHPASLDRHSGPKPDGT
jgi:Flp pilus assembly pilin Flp